MAPEKPFVPQFKNEPLWRPFTYYPGLHSLLSQKDEFVLPEYPRYRFRDCVCFLLLTFLTLFLLAA